MITNQQIDEMAEKIAKATNPYKIIVFGSYAYGQPNEDSDLDFCVIEKTVTSKIAEKRKIRESLGKVNIALDLLVPDLAEYDFYKNEINSVYNDIETKGRIVWPKTI